MNKALYPPAAGALLGVHASCPHPGSTASLLPASCFECLLTLPAFLLKGFLLNCWKSVKPGNAGVNALLTNEEQELPAFLMLCTEVPSTLRPVTLECEKESPRALIKMQILIQEV